jgi:L-malate glycosyltransferase
MANTRMTVCQVLHSLDVGGAEVLASRLARRLGMQHRFVFACLDDLGALGEGLRQEGFPVCVLGRRPGVDWRCVARLASFMRRERVDLLHAHQTTPFAYCLMARLLYPRPPLLFTEHGRHFPDRPHRKRMIANQVLLQKRDRVVGVGQAVRRALIANEGIPAERVSVIYNGIDLAPFAELDDGEAVRRELGLRPDALVLLYVARLDPIKDHATALRTFERVLPEIPDARLVLVGEGAQRAEIEQWIGERNLAGHVLLLGLRHDVARLLGAADLLLLTSLSEGIPLAILEAMAAGVPVVSTRVGGVEEVVENGRTGLLAPARDDTALAQHILRLANDRGFREPLTRAARERVRECFSEDMMTRSYSELYSSVFWESSRTQSA